MALTEYGYVTVNTAQTSHILDIENGLNLYLSVWMGEC